MTTTAFTRAHQCWSTSNVDSNRALAYWIDTVCKSFLEIEIDSPCGDRFQAHLTQTQLGPATLSLIEAEAQTVRRTRARIAGSRYSSFFLLQLREGIGRLAQNGRECALRPGDSVLIDCKEPYEFDCLSHTRSVVLRFQQEWLRNWIPAPEDLVARPLSAATGWGAALSATLAALDTNESETFALPDEAVAEQIAAVLALAAGPQVRAQSAGDKLLHRLQRAIRARSHEPDLTPASIADENGISTRYLHFVFGEAGTTFGAEVMRMRLEHAKRMLSDKRFDALPVGEIAARCGFVAPSHFARRFRQAYGLVPTEFRTTQR